MSKALDLATYVLPDLSGYATNTDVTNAIDGIVIPEGSTSGTWTPAGNGITFSAASGRWVKVGNMVTVWFNITYPTTSSGSAARITGLPQTVGDNNAWGVLGNQNNVAATDIMISADASGTHINIRNLAGNEKSNGNMSGMTIQGGVTYSIAN